MGLCTRKIVDLKRFDHLRKPPKSGKIVHLTDSHRFRRRQWQAKMQKRQAMGGGKDVA